jgi:hypothetical protein
MRFSFHSTLLVVAFVALLATQTFALQAAPTPKCTVLHQKLPAKYGEQLTFTKSSRKHGFYVDSANGHVKSAGWIAHFFKKGGSSVFTLSAKEKPENTVLFEVTYWNGNRKAKTVLYQTDFGGLGGQACQQKVPRGYSTNSIKEVTAYWNENEVKNHPDSKN